VRGKNSYQDKMPNSSLRTLPILVEYARDIRRSAPGLSIVALTLLLLSSLFEGVGYLLLLPILGYLGLNSRGASTPAEGMGSFLDPVLNILNPHLSLGLLLVLFLGVLTSRAILTYLAASSTALLKGRFLHHHRSALHKALLSASWAFLSRKRRSALTHALTTQSNIIVNGVDTLFRCVATLFAMGISVSVAAILSWKITLGVLSIVLVFLWPLKYFNHKAFKLGDQARNDMVSLFEHSIRYFKGLKTIKSTSAEKDILAFFENRSLAQSKVFSALERNHAKANLVYQLGSALFLVGFVYVTLTFFPYQKAQIIVLIVIFARLAPRANALQIYANGLSAIMPEYLAAKDLYHTALNAEDVGGLPNFPTEVRRVLGLSNISFSYPYSDENAAVIKNLTLSFPMKSSAAIVGPSGAGKTTLADLIAGLFTLGAGELTVDGRILTEAELRGLRQSIRYIPDEDFLFDDTLRKNLLLGLEEVSDENLWRALKNANAFDFVNALPQGLDTQIGDSGIRLSHGQRQRLSLTRGLLGNPQILILDEPTSALSQQDLDQILDTLKTLSREMIVIIITHDEANFEWVDQIIRLD
jgi:ATP-binding cassette subfamily C protein